MPTNPQNTPPNNEIKDYSELLTQVLGELAEELINYDQRMTQAGAPNIRFVHKYTSKAKQSLIARHKADIKEAERKARIDEVWRFSQKKNYSKPHSYYSQRMYDLTKDTFVLNAINTTEGEGNA